MATKTDTIDRRHNKAEIKVTVQRENRTFLENRQQKKNISTLRAHGRRPASREPKYNKDSQYIIARPHAPGCKARGAHFTSLQPN